MRLTLLLVIALLLGLAPVTPVQQSDIADLVFKNGYVYTVDAKQPRAQAIGVIKDRIVFVGSNADAQKYVGPKTRVVDLKGSTVLPGFDRRASTSLRRWLSRDDAESRRHHQPRRLSGESKSAGGPGEAGRMGDGTWLDRNFLETAGISDALGPRQSRA